MAKGQAEIVVFVLLLMITLVLVFMAVGWGQGIGQNNLDVSKISAAENWMKTLDEKIESVIKSGGSARLDYALGSEIRLIDVGLNDTIEVTMPIGIDMPANLMNLTSVGDMGVISERKEGTNLKLRLSYPLRQGFGVDLFTDGPQIATPAAVLIDRNVTSIQNIAGDDYTVASIRIRFV